MIHCFKRRSHALWKHIFRAMLKRNLPFVAFVGISSKVAAPLPVPPRQVRANPQLRARLPQRSRGTQGALCHLPPEAHRDLETLRGYRTRIMDSPFEKQAAQRTCKKNSAQTRSVNGCAGFALQPLQFKAGAVSQNNSRKLGA